MRYKCCAGCVAKGLHQGCPFTERARVVDNGEVRELYEHIKHQSGVVERRVYARIEIKTDRLLSMNLL